MAGISLNEDCNHYIVSRRHRELTAEEVERWVDQYADTQVEELVLNVNAMRTCYDSRVWESFWSGYDPLGGNDQPFLAGLPEEARELRRQWVHRGWQLHRDGIDLFERWIARARERGISPWISVRMNDIHCVDNELDPMHSTLWRQHPELRRAPYKFDDWADKAFDYARPEVREHHFRLIEELAERYDFDGLELDWMRFGYHFRPGFEEEGAAILTQFTADVRALLDRWEAKRGHRIKLSARVASRPQTALSLGMDAVEWAKRGLVDMLVVTPFWATIETDMPIELWKQLLRGTDVTLAAGIEVLIRAFPKSALRQMNTLETVRGAASSLLSRGADRIYLFNYMDSDTAMADLDNYNELLCGAGALETMAGKPRRHIVTYSDTWAPGEAAGFQLPAACPPGRFREFRLHVGPRPEGPAYLYLGVLPGEELSGEVRLNGVVCAAEGVAELAGPRPEGPVYRFRIPEEAVHGGYNVAELLPDRETTVIWVELATS
ncbi:glycoside hydrolase family 10 protein [Paenibacillus cymbidii]|uniref:hypothetical protein n=1 Tax=Paenibacillus cymbidii TaxID=1639034 RepID=UPI00108133F7|nr:hypothetical protein [Paenibacillus cymbidii]